MPPGPLKGPLSPADGRRVEVSRPIRAVLRRLSRDEAGFTLTELLVTMSLLSIVMAATLGLLDTQAKVTPRETERAHAIRDAQVGLHGMTRELRQATSIITATPSQMVVELAKGGVQRRVGYKCDERPVVDDPSNPYDDGYLRCSRLEGPAGAALPSYVDGTSVIERLQNPNVFTYSPSAADPTYASVRVIVHSRGVRKEGSGYLITLDDGIFLRNRSTNG